MRHSAITFLLDTVKKLPDRLCLSDSRESLKFSQFFSRAFSLAETIKKDAQINQPVLVYLPKCASSMVAFAAILMSGSFYVPLDVQSPKKRLQNILSQFTSYMVISTKQHEEDLQKLSIPPENIIFIEDVPSSKGNLTIEEMIDSVQTTTKQIIDLDPCYMMYTSGSTGIPKA